MSNPIETAMKQADIAIAYEVRTRYRTDTLHEPAYELLNTKSAIKTRDGEKVVIVVQEWRIPTNTNGVSILTTLQAIVII